jgi:lycopene cyclase domain-containing protein
MQWLYFLALSVSLAGLAALDARFKLAFWSDARRAIRVIGLSVGLFIIWDACGIALNIFKHGASPYNLPVTLAPHFPVEEIVFLILLCYVSLLAYLAMKKRLQ